MRVTFCKALFVIASLSAAQPASADVVTDWNETALGYVAQRNLGPPPGERVMAMVHAAMFDAVNSIERRYRPYLVQRSAPAGASREAAAAAAAGTVLSGLHSETQAEMGAALVAYLATIPDSRAKSQGIALGEAVGAAVLAVRANDGSNAPDTYRPRTTAGVYITTVPTAAPHWPGVTPFAMTSSSQFRPPAPIALDSAQWAADYNEIKEYGGRNSMRRSARQSEDARFWLANGGNVYYPVVRAIAASERLSLLDNARLFALVSIARADALIAVFDAKYHYGFWRPVTAIRNGDIDGNPATERDAAWQPMDATPMHPEYPCAHCIAASSMATVLEAVLGGPDIQEVVLTSPTAPGVTHRWTNLHAFVTEVSEARIWAGFHYRSSTRVGVDMGRRIGEYTVTNFVQPVRRRRR